MMRPRVYTERLELWLSKRDIALLERVRKRCESESKKRWTKRMVVRAALIELSRSGVDSWRLRERKLLDAAARERAMQVQLQARVRTLYDALGIESSKGIAPTLRASVKGPTAVPRDRRVLLATAAAVAGWRHL